MSQASSITGLSSANSFNTFRQGAWCTPPRLFVEDQVFPSFDNTTMQNHFFKSDPFDIKHNSFQPMDLFAV